MYTDENGVLFFRDFTINSNFRSNMNNLIYNIYGQLFAVLLHVSLKWLLYYYRCSTENSHKNETFEANYIRFGLWNGASCFKMSLSFENSECNFANQFVTLLNRRLSLSEFVYMRFFIIKDWVTIFGSCKCKEKPSMWWFSQKKVISLWLRQKRS